MSHQAFALVGAIALFLNRPVGRSSSGESRLARKACQTLNRGARLSLSPRPSHSSAEPVASTLAPDPFKTAGGCPAPSQSDPVLRPSLPVLTAAPPSVLWLGDLGCDDARHFDEHSRPNGGDERLY